MRGERLACTICASLAYLRKQHISCACLRGLTNRADARQVRGPPRRTAIRMVAPVLAAYKRSRRTMTRHSVRIPFTKLNEDSRMSCKRPSRSEGNALNLARTDVASSMLVYWVLKHRHLQTSGAAVAVELNVSASPIACGCERDVFRNRQRMSSSISFLGWPLMMASRVSAR